MPFDDQKERNKALEIAVGQIEKQFGKGSIMRPDSGAPSVQSMSFPPAPSASTMPLGLVACRADGSWKSIPSRPAKPRWRCK